MTEQPCRDKTSVTRHANLPAAQTYVTRHVTRGRLKRLEAILGESIDDLLQRLVYDVGGDENSANDLPDALCVSWFGQIFRNKQPRADRGGSHTKPERRWLCLCRWCDDQLFYASRPDAHYCSNHCRQAAYRLREAARLEKHQL